MLVLVLSLILQITGCDDKTALIQAIRVNDLKKIQQLLDKGVEVNSRVDDEQRTPLMIAAMEGNPEITQLLIDRGADIFATNKYGRTPLHFAARGGNCATIRTLVSSGARINPPDEPFHTVLMEAAASGKSDAVKCLVKLGAKVDLVDGGGTTALIHAVWSHDFETVKALVESGADSMKRNKQGYTALDIASQLENGDKMAAILRTVSP